MRFPLGLLGREESDKNSQASCSKQGEPQLVLKHDWSGRATGVIRFKPTAKDRGQHRSWKLQRNLERLWQGTEIGENFTELEIPRRNSANTLEFPVVSGMWLIERALHALRFGVYCMMWNLEVFLVGLESEETFCMRYKRDLLLVYVRKPGIQAQILC